MTILPGVHPHIIKDCDFPLLAVMFCFFCCFFHVYTVCSYVHMSVISLPNTNLWFLSITFIRSSFQLTGTVYFCFTFPSVTDIDSSSASLFLIYFVVYFQFWRHNGLALTYIFFYHIFCAFFFNVTTEDWKTILNILNNKQPTSFATHHSELPSSKSFNTFLY